jgi:solute carrier family 6 amino acid transporter-like protein 5/7/9/14
MASHRSYLDLREGWSNRCEFVMSCITSAVGLGNIWRFPFIAAQNGGGAFLIPYLLVVLFIGRPLYIMELGMGQFTSRGPVKCWEMAPFFRGSVPKVTQSHSVSKKFRILNEVFEH